MRIGNTDDRITMIMVTLSNDESPQSHEYESLISTTQKLEKQTLELRKHFKLVGVNSFCFLFVIELNNYTSTSQCNCSSHVITVTFT